MTPEELDTLVSRIAAHANGENRKGRDHLPEFNNPALGKPLGIGDRAGLERHVLETLLDERTIGCAQANGHRFYYNPGTNTEINIDPKGNGTVFRSPGKVRNVKRKRRMERAKQRNSQDRLPFRSGGLLAHDRDLAKTLRERALARETPRPAKERYAAALKQAGGEGPDAIRRALAINAKQFAKEQAGLSEAIRRSTDEVVKNRLTLRAKIETADHEAVTKAAKAKLHAHEQGPVSTPALRETREARAAKATYDAASGEWHKRAVRDESYASFDSRLSSQVESIRKQESRQWDQLAAKARQLGLTPSEEKLRKAALERRLNEQLEQSFAKQSGLTHSR